MPSIDCYVCGEKIWGHLEVLPEKGLCRGCKAEKKIATEQNEKIEQILTILHQDREERINLQYDLLVMGNRLIKALEGIQKSLESKSSIELEDSEHFDDWEGYSKEDARADYEHEAWAKEEQEAAYYEAERANDEVGPF